MRRDLRVIGGALRGRRIIAPKGGGARPTLSRRRETLFNILEHGEEAVSWKKTVALDIFAGAGGLGFEALSRGASAVIFLDDSRDALRAIRENAARLGVGPRVKSALRDARKLGARPHHFPPADLAFMDPPYGWKGWDASLSSLARGRWLRLGAILILEEERRGAFSFESLEDFTLSRTHQSGRTRFTIMRYKGA